MVREGTCTDDLKEKAKFLECALKVNPDNRETKEELALATGQLKAQAAKLVDDGQGLLKAGEAEKAYAMFLAATELNPLDEDAWLGCARANGDLDLALSFAKRALEINRNNAEARELYSWLWTPRGGKGGAPEWSAWRVILIILPILVIVVSLAILALSLFYWGRP